MCTGEVRPCDPFARVRPCVPCVPCVSRLPPVSFFRCPGSPGVFLPVEAPVRTAETAAAWRTSRCCSPLAARRAARRAPIQRNLPPQRLSHNSKPHTTTLPASCSRRWQTHRSHVPHVSLPATWRLPLRRALAVAATASGINRRKKQLPQRRSHPSALGPSQLQRQRARK